MHWINWVIVVTYLTYVVVDGIRKSKGTDTMAGYFAANKSLPWWVVGLSVMATQLSAVTMIGTTGQGATEGLRFVQIYFGLPLAMVILMASIDPPPILITLPQRRYRSIGRLWERPRAPQICTQSS